MNKIGRALISVFDKQGVVDFARGLDEMGVEILSTGGTARLLSSKNIPVREVSEITNFPEIMNGRVKTLHPKIHGGLLAIRRNPSHMKALEEQSIQPIDLVCINLYPFLETTQRQNVTFDEIIENIDIGGPSMIRSAAKNFSDVAVITNPDDYSSVLSELRQGNGRLPLPQLFSLSQKAFIHTAQYDGQIAQFLSNVHPEGKTLKTPLGSNFPNRLFMDFEKVADLRYGENPHQKAAFYRWGANEPHGLANAQQLQGKELSYNNLVDLDAAWALIQEFEEPACCIIKHTNPCGTAIGQDLREAYLKAYEADTISSFGSVIAVNRAIDRATAEDMCKLFVEAVIAPDTTDGARKVFAHKKTLRLLKVPKSTNVHGLPRLEAKRVIGGILLQDPDESNELSTSAVRVVTSRQPTDDERQDLFFAWKVAKHVKSNAIVLACGLKTTGIGAGQMSRVDSVRISVEKLPPSSKATVLASDAFFPFRDGIDEAAKAGITAVIQPGGSKRDEEVIQAANEHGMTMMFTGTRHFKH